MKHTYEEAMNYAIQTKAAAIMEKDGTYLTAKNWDEIEYAQSCGWKYLGHPADLMQA